MKARRKKVTGRAALALWTRRLSVRKTLEARARKRHEAHPTAASRKLLDKRKAQVAAAVRGVARWEKRVNPLRVRALKVAESLVGVMEQGGNNVGKDVEKIIRGGGGVRGQAWCGWFNAFCYRLAGSRAVTWEWGSVRLLRRIAGVKKVRHPLPGDIVEFTFDHEGMFRRAASGGEIETIEGNTGRSGAVSDSKTGGDGVYVKRRATNLVAAYWRVLR